MAFLDKLKKLVQQAPDTADPPAREELDSLLNAAIEMATKLIEAHGNNIPFCMAIARNGEGVNFAIDDGAGPSTDELVDSLRKEVTEAVRENKFRALVFAKNVTYRSANDGQVTDAVQLTLDHQKGSPSTCYLPYRLVSGRVVPGELFATEPLERFFLPKASFVVGPDGGVSSTDPPKPE